MRVQNGTISAHDKTWPLYEREGIDAEGKAIMILEMAPEDQAEKHALDEKVVDEYLHPEKATLG